MAHTWVCHTRTHPAARPRAERGPWEGNTRPPPAQARSRATEGRGLTNLGSPSGPTQAARQEWGERAQWERWGRGPAGLATPSPVEALSPCSGRRPWRAQGGSLRRGLRKAPGHAVPLAGLPAPGSLPLSRAGRAWRGVLTALGHADVPVGVEEDVAVGTEAALCQPHAQRALAPARRQRQIEGEGSGHGAGLGSTSGPGWEVGWGKGTPEIWSWGPGAS